MATSRNVEPYKLVRNGNGDVIVYAYCLDKEGIRTFKLHNVSDLVLQDYTFTPRWDIVDQVD